MATIPVFAIRTVPRAANGRRYNRPPELVAIGTIVVNRMAITSPQGAACAIGEHHQSAGATLFFLVIDEAESPVCLCTIDPGQIAPDIFASFISILGPRHRASIIAVEHAGTGGSILPLRIDRVRVLLEAATAIGAELLDYVVVSHNGNVLSLVIENERFGRSDNEIDLHFDHFR
jgi:hypothetical protein